MCAPYIRACWKRPQTLNAYDGVFYRGNVQLQKKIYLKRSKRLEKLNNEIVEFNKTFIIKIAIKYVASFYGNYICFSYNIKLF